MGIKLINLLTRIRILKEKNNEKYINKIKRICDNYMIGSEYIKSNVHTVINIFLITLVQRMFLLAVTWIVYKSYGLSGTGFWNIIALQTMIGVAVEMLPLPGCGRRNRGLLHIYVHGHFHRRACKACNATEPWTQLLFTADNERIGNIRGSLYRYEE